MLDRVSVIGSNLGWIAITEVYNIAMASKIKYSSPIKIRTVRPKPIKTQLNHSQEEAAKQKLIECSEI